MGVSHRVGKFNPLHLYGCTWWHKASMGLTLVGSAVSGWADQTGHGNHFTEATARPTYTDGVLNGKPGLLFNSSRMVFSPPVAQTADSTFVVVLKPTASPAYQTILSRSDSASPAYYRDASTQLIYLGASKSGQTITANVGNICVFRHKTSTLKIAMNVNGAVDTQYDVASIPLSTWTNIGSLITSPTTQSYIGYWLEDIKYDRWLTTDEERQLLSYLSREYAITLAA